MLGWKRDPGMGGLRCLPHVKTINNTHITSLEDRERLWETLLWTLWSLYGPGEDEAVGEESVNYEVEWLGH